MKISQVARDTGLSSKTIRYYEDIALIPRAARARNGYRDYDAPAVRELTFLAHAREVGFDLDECRQLLELQRDPQRQSVHAKQLVLEKVGQLDLRITALNRMRDQLAEMVARCQGDEGPECAILDDLENVGRNDHAGKVPGNE